MRSNAMKSAAMVAPDWPRLFLRFSQLYTRIFGRRDQRVPCGDDGYDGNGEGTKEEAHAERDSRRRTHATYVVNFQQMHQGQHLALRVLLVLELRKLVIASKDGSSGLRTALSLRVCMRQKR
jgi:hypothetical protein